MTTVAHVNGVLGGGSSTSGTVSLSMTAGNFVIACLNIDSHTAAAVRGGSFSDNAGNVWTQQLVSQSTQTSHFQATELWWTIAKTTATVVITVGISGTNNGWSVDVHQFSGVDPVFPFSERVPNGMTTNYTTTASQITASQPINRAAGGAIMSFVTTNLFPTTLAAPSGFTGDAGQTSGSAAIVQGAYKLESSATTETTTWTSGTTTQWCLMNVSLQPATVLSLDGSNTQTSATGTATNISATITTTKTNDIIVVVVAATDTATLRTVSSISATGLTFTKRSSDSFTGSGGRKVGIEVWWALATSAQSAKNVQVNYSAAPNDDIMMWVFGVNGADTSSPWDSNGSLPSFTKDVSGSFSSEVSSAFSTQGTDRFIFAFGLNNGSNVQGVGPIGGRTPIAIASQISAGTQDSFIQYIPNAPTAAGITSSIFGGTASYWEMVVDALAPANPNNSTGNITTSLTKASIAGVGAMYPKGTIATNLTKASMSASGAMYPKGTITTALTKASIVGAGKVDPRGTITTALTKASQRLQGSGVNSGTITTALSKASFSLVGKASIKGTILTTLQPTSQSLSGKVSPTGKITTTLSHISQSVAATMAQGGTITTRLRSLSQSLSGSAPPAGTIVTRLPRLSQQANGWAEIIGAAVTDLAGSAVHMHAQTFEVFTGTIQMDLSGFLQNMQAREIFTGSIVTQLGPIAQDAAAEEIFTGTIYTKLGNANGSVIANVVEAAVIIQGPIEMNLGPLDVTALGALLGSPGAGKWYSWRQTDN